MKRSFSLLAALLAGSGSALTLAGRVVGTPAPDTRLSVWAVGAAGQPVQELVSVPLQGERFQLALPPAPPSFRAQGELSAQNIAWPGVLDPVTVTGSAQVAELKFFTYRDLNRSGQRDEDEALREVTVTAGRGTLFAAWVNADVTVRAARGYEAALKRGWNALVVEVGRTVRVTPFASGAVEVTLGR